jgi:signal transduction histidine kinase
MRIHDLPWWQKRTLAGIRNSELVAVLLAYFLYALLYWVTIVANTDFEPGATVFFAKQISVNYGVKLLLTLPVWWLIFRRLRDWPLPRRLLLHLPLSVAYVLAWLCGYHLVCDLLGISYMTGSGQVWDLYIPVLLYLLQFGLFHTYEYVQRARAEALRVAEMRQLALSAEISALKAQIQPHFLFNTLNSISASLPPEQERTRELIAQLADTFRFALQASQCDTVPLREELDFLRNYLALAQQRFGERLHVRIQAPEHLLSRPVPPMLLQPLVENALQHAVGPSVASVELSIRAWATAERMCLEVADTGPTLPTVGPPVLPENGIGLRNTRLRLRKQFGTELQARYNLPQGLVFTMEIE